MKAHLHDLKKSALFASMADDEILAIMGCVGAKIKRYKKDDLILRSGDISHNVGVVLKGSVHIMNEDFWGNRNILTRVEEGQIFAESHACLGTERLNISVVANDRTNILFIDVRRIMNVCTSACAFHNLLIRNLMWCIAEKNLNLTRRIEHTSKRSTREKLLSYLSEQSRLIGSSSFEIPFNRQQLADYLSVDRSAMSNELSKLRDEGILEFDKNKFKLNDL